MIGPSQILSDVVRVNFLPKLLTRYEYEISRLSENIQWKRTVNSAAYLSTQREYYHK